MINVNKHGIKYKHVQDFQKKMPPFLTIVKKQKKNTEWWAKEAGRSSLKKISTLDFFWKTLFLYIFLFNKWEKKYIIVIHEMIEA